MKLRTFEVGDIWIEDLFKGNFGEFKSNMPNDLKILGVNHDDLRMSSTFVVLSEFFEDIKDTYPIPKIKFICKRTEKVE
jgi:hypothetical protein